MSSSTSLIFIIIIAVCIGLFYFYRKGKLPWLKGIKAPRIFEPKAETRVEKLEEQAEKEIARAGELRSVLEAKTKLAKARAENIRLIKEIESVSEKSVEKGRQAEKKALEAESVKPRRL